VDCNRGEATGGEGSSRSRCAEAAGSENLVVFHHIPVLLENQIKTISAFGRRETSHLQLRGGIQHKPLPIIDLWLAAAVNMRCSAFRKKISAVV
jgi:hypothetical protein